MRLVVIYPLLVLGSLGCSTPGLTSSRLFFAGDVAGAESVASEEASHFDEDYALHKEIEASARLVRRDWEGAHQSILAAHRVIEDFSGNVTREILAIVGRESAKVYKGEPHERVMNAYYGGLLYAIRGDFENARAGFRNALFRDSPTEGGADFGPALYFLARHALQLGHEEEARDLLSILTQRFPDLEAAKSPDLNANVIFLFDLGRGPMKTGSGRQESEIRYRNQSGLSSGVRVSFEGQGLGRAQIIEDIYYQAATRGDRDFDDVLQGKAIAKDITETSGIGLLWLGLNSSGKSSRKLIGVGGALFALSSLIQSQVDLRHWSTLPREIQILEATLPPGTHQLQFQMGTHVIGREVTVPARGEVVVYSRPDMEAIWERRSGLERSSEP